MDIPVFVKSETLKEINVSRLKKEIADRHVSSEKVEQLERDLADLKRLTENGILTDCQFKECWKRAYKKYCGLVGDFGRRVRSGGF